MKKVIVRLLLIITALTSLALQPTTNAAGTTSPEMRKIILRAIGHADLTDSFIQKTEEVAVNLNADPNDLIAIMYFESARTFDPAKKVGISRKTGKHVSSAVGLIQFLKDTANELGIAKCRYETDGITPNQPLPTIAKQSRESQMDCVQAYFQKYRDVDQFDLATLYATVNYPARRNMPLNSCWYDSSTTEFKTNPALAQYAEIASNGKLCVTKNSATSSIQAILKTAGITSYNPSSRASGLSDQLANLVFPEIELHVASDEELEQFRDQIENTTQASINRAIDNTIALPATLFESCTIVVTNPTTPALVESKAITSCIKSVLNYIFIFAVIWVLISLTAANLGTVTTSGQNNSTPIKTAREKLEKSLIGLFLIGAPYLLLDLFTGTSGAFNIIPLEKLPNITPFQVQIGSGLPDTFTGNADTAIDLGGFIPGLGLASDADTPGISYTHAIDIQRSGDTDTTSRAPDDCGKFGLSGGPRTRVIYESPECKTLNVPYVNQSYNSKNQKSPWGATACGAASAVMIGNYWSPSLYDNSTGKNNINNYSLRDQVFLGSSYFKTKITQLRTDTRCNYTIGTDGATGKSDVDGAWAIMSGKTGVDGAKVQCYYNLTEYITDRYLPMYNVTSRKINYGNKLELAGKIKASIDNGRPLLLLFNGGFGNHFAVIKGYYKDDINKIIMNDPYGNFSLSGSSSPTSGNGAIYDLTKSSMNIISVYETAL